MFWRSVLCWDCAWVFSFVSSQQFRHYNRGDSSLTSCRDSLCVFDGRHGAYDRQAVGCWPVVALRLFAAE